MKSSLLCPNQLRSNGLIVDDVPQHLAPINHPSTHSVQSIDDDFILPLSLKGVISYFTTRTPTQEELNTCKWIHLTNEYNWDPHSESFNEQEANYTSLQTTTAQNRYIFSTKSIINSTLYHTVHAEISKALDDSNFTSLHISSTNTSMRTSVVTPEILSSRWHIGLDTARKTIQVTTQKGIRSYLNPIEQRYRTKQAQLRYRQLSGRHGRFYTDTFFSSIPSINACKMAQLYINDLSYTKIYPMKTKSQTPDTLTAFIHDVGIPNAIHSDDAPELLHGTFRKLCKDYGIQNTYTEPYSPWQNRAEGGIRELK
jgi:hypothetical protein